MTREKRIKNLIKKLEFMWIVIFSVFLAINTVTYFIFLKYKEQKFVNIIYFSLFVGFLMIIGKFNESWPGLKFFHSLLMSCMYYLFLVVSSLQFEFLYKNKTLTQPVIKKNIQIGIGIVSAWVSTDTYLFYS